MKNLIQYYTKLVPYKEELYGNKVPTRSEYETAEELIQMAIVNLVDACSQDADTDVMANMWADGGDRSRDTMKLVCIAAVIHGYATGQVGDISGGGDGETAYMTVPDYVTVIKGLDISLGRYICGWFGVEAPGDEPVNGAMLKEVAAALGYEITGFKKSKDKV